jgi:transcription-repair coupling factor (superfamily II helicase)
MRDLEIRGAGNLLGPEQHGHIAAVGYDLYSKLLGEAVRELHGEPAVATVEPVISLGAEGLLPEEYVPEVNQRLALYKRLAAAESDRAVAELRAELADRFGPPPAVAEQLLDTVRIRVAARPLAIEKLEVGEGKAVITFAPSTPIDPQRLVQAIQRSRGRLRLRREFTVEAPVVRGPWPALRDSVLRLLEELAAA